MNIAKILWQGRRPVPKHFTSHTSFFFVQSRGLTTCILKQ